MAEQVPDRDRDRDDDADDDADQPLFASAEERAELLAAELARWAADGNEQAAKLQRKFAELERRSSAIAANPACARADIEAKRRRLVHKCNRVAKRVQDKEARHRAGLVKLTFNTERRLWGYDARKQAIKKLLK
jgi:hypothetical protein